jgi:dienelactone hydrolase
MMIPKVWKSNMGWRHRERLQREAGALAARSVPPQSTEAWDVRRRELRGQLAERLKLTEDATPVDFRVHRSIAREGYRIDLVSYASGSPEIRVTAALYVPDGPGPFPAVLNLHGHWQQGHLAARVQERGHVLAQHGFVVLSPDAPGTGERSVGEGLLRYHGGAAGAGLYLIGDSLLGWQVRDNRRAIDVLCARPQVDPARIGVTGASGGGNQTMWISACDDRVKACVPVVSAGTFAAYVSERNCICETLPGGLTFMEEWELLGLIAPRPVLLLNAYKDSSPAFGPEAVTRTAQALRDLYALWHADEKFDSRIINLPHGFWPEMLSAMLGWMKYWLKGEGPGFSLELPPIMPEDEAAMRCFASGSWPAATQAYAANKETLLAALPSAPAGMKDATVLRMELAKCIGYGVVRGVPDVDEGHAQGPESIARAVLESPRGLALPVVIREAQQDSPVVNLIVGAAGKSGPFAAARFAAAERAVAVDLPGVGELAWESVEPVGGAVLHDTARACLWLGYTLAGEWAECVAALVHWAQVRFPGRTLRLVADREAALAVLLAAALDPCTRTCERDLAELPESLVECYRAEECSLAMMIPGLLKWGDLYGIKQLATD